MPYSTQNPTNSTTTNTISFDRKRLRSDIDDLICSSDILADIANTLQVITQLDNLEQIQSVARLAQFNAESGANFIDTALADIRTAILKFNATDGVNPTDIIDLDGKQLQSDINDLNMVGTTLQAIAKTLNSIARGYVKLIPSIHSLIGLAQPRITNGVNLAQTALDNLDKAINNAQDNPCLDDIGRQVSHDDDLEQEIEDNINQLHSLQTEYDQLKANQQKVSSNTSVDTFEKIILNLQDLVTLGQSYTQQINSIAQAMSKLATQELVTPHVITDLATTADLLALHFDIDVDQGFEDLYYLQQSSTGLGNDNVIDTATNTDTDDIHHLA